MPSDPRLILSSHEDAAVFPESWEETGYVEYLYRKNAILVRDRDADRVIEALREIPGEASDLATLGDEVPPFERQRVLAGVLKVSLPSALPSVPEVLDRLDANLGRGVATPDHMLRVSRYLWSAGEPRSVPGTVGPLPPPGLDARPGADIPRPACDGDGITTTVVDTGLVDAATDHAWLAGVVGDAENPYDPGGNILPYAGHGTFVAGCLRCSAPRVSVVVKRAFDVAGANYESNVAPSLDDAVRLGADILVFTFATPTRLDQPLLTFENLYETRISKVKGLVIVAPAGNDGRQSLMWPAAHSWVISVGSLSASGRDRAAFSNFGRWVDVFAPGEDLVNAFAAGSYVCGEPPVVGEVREFAGMAMWSGTSFSTPIVAGLIAARMSATGENGQQAADSLLRFARSQAIPGLGAVLYPGQACCEADP
jgi:hypothetical protein